MRTVSSLPPPAAAEQRTDTCKWRGTAAATATSTEQATAGRGQGCMIHVRDKDGARHDLSALKLRAVLLCIDADLAVLLYNGVVIQQCAYTGITAVAPALKPNMHLNRDLIEAQDGVCMSARQAEPAAAW